jgi:hypothetical protein
MSRQYVPIQVAELHQRRCGHLHRQLLKPALINECGVHLGAVERWRMGWLTDKLPEEEIRLFMASGMSPKDAAQNVAR